jgi:integrase
MPVANLTPQIVQSSSCPAGKSKLDLFDSGCRGLMLEIRPTERKTYYLRYQDARKKQHQYRIGDARDLTLAMARKEAEKLRAKLAVGEDIREKKVRLQQIPTLTELVNGRYLPFAQTYKRSWKTDECLLRNHVIPRFGHLYLDQLKKPDIVSFVAAHLKTHKPGSVNRVIILLRYLFNCAKRWEIPGAEKNPTDGVPLLPENNKKERYLSEDEARRLYESVCKSENTMLQFIVPMLILTGARKREVLDAKWQDFDFERRLWRIPTTKLGKPRHVPLSDGVMSLLSTMPRNLKSDYVFANPKTNLPFVSIFCAWDTARKRAGLADVRIHDLRHSFASLLINSGRSLYEVQKLLGHTQVRTTQRYAHLAPETLLAASNAATRAVGSIMGVMPNRVVDVPLVAAQG